MNDHINDIRIIGAVLILLLGLMIPAPVTAYTNAAAADLQIETAAAADPPDSLVCLDCHRASNIHTNEGVIASQTFCLDCHAREDTHRLSGNHQVNMVVRLEDFKKNQPIHQYNACIHCHTDVAKSPHRTETGAICLDCHTPHSEGPAHSPHLRVDCQACHFQAAFVTLDRADFRIKLSHEDDQGAPVSLASHEMTKMDDPKACLKCHHPDNTVGAPASVLPSKSGMCILCHTASLSAGHPVFSLAGLVFMSGILMMVGFWYKGSVKGEEDSLHRKIAISSESVWKTLFSRKAFSLFKVFILDIVLQRRILKESVSRWSMHSLIFTAILLRFGLSLFTAAGYYFYPEGSWFLALMDKNHGFTAFINDLLGIFILTGIVWAVIKRFVVKPDHVVSEYQDTATLIILGALVIFGFILEGARIHSTGIPPEMASYAFAGNGVAWFCSLFPVNWSTVYPILWWTHGLWAAVFIAYIPFGKMKHIFNTPLTYFIEDVDGVKNEKRV